MGTLVIVMCGIPGAGKTFLSLILQERFRDDGRVIRVVHYDSIAQQMQWDAHSFHAVRSLGLASLREAIVEARADVQRKEHVIIVDDNMHRKSMRREVYVVARDEQVASMLVYCNASRETCELRNAQRERDRVADESFANVCEQFEEPQSTRVFDRPLVVVDTNDLDRVARCMHSLWDEILLAQADATRVQAEPPRQAPPQEKSALQRVDEELRKRVASLLVAHRPGSKTEDARRVGEAMARIKRESLCTARSLLPAFIAEDAQIDLDGFLAACLHQFERRADSLALPRQADHALDAPAMESDAAR